MASPLIPSILSNSIKTTARKAVGLILLTSIFLLGCKKPAETEAANEPQTTEATTVNSPVTVNDASNADTINEVALSQPLTILALGDSLTEGLGVERDGNYPAQLEAKLKEMGYVNVDVVNSGLSGETSTGLVNRLDWVSQTEPDITILTIGANDAIRGLDIATIEKNIRTAVTHLQDNGSEVILGGMQIYDNLGNDYVKSFSAIYPRIAEDMNLKMIPFFLEGVGGDPELNQADAIHPTKEGYTIIVDNNILPVLKPEVDRMLQSMQANSLTPVETPTTETAQ